MHTSIPAGAGEKMQYMVHAFNDNTIRFVLRYPEQLQAEALKQAAFALTGSVEVLHASFEAGRVKACWQVREVRMEDCFTHIVTQEDPEDIALREALQPRRAQDPAQLHCILVEGAQDCAVVLLVSHLCADGVDSLYLLRKLCEAYTMQLRVGSCEALQVKNGSRAAEQAYDHLSREELRALMKDPRTGVRCGFTFPTEEPGEPVVIWRRIPEEQMTAAHERARLAGATVNDLLLTACYYAYVEVSGFDAGTPVSIMSMMDLRKHTEDGDSAGLCNMTGSLATALPEGLRATFSDTLADIAAQTRRLKNDPYAGLYGMPLLHAAARRLPMGLLLAAASRIYGSMSVGMTNVGRITGESLRMGELLPAQAWFGGPIKRKPGVQISVISLEGDCTLCLWGWATMQDKAVLQQLTDRLAAHVAAFAAGER